MKCVCGFRKFRESLRSSTETVTRWMRVPASQDGFGSTPFGTLFGSGSVSGTWGGYDIAVSRTSRVVTCESCGRERSNTVVGGIGVFDTYVRSGALFLVVTDTDRLTCYRVRFSSAFGDIDLSLVPYSGEPSLPDLVPARTEPSLPAGALRAGILTVALPDAPHDGTYEVSLVDVCAGTTLSLTAIDLESTVQIHSPREADFNGIPRLVVEHGARAAMPAAQPSSGAAVRGIPFDYCRTVIEYDARFGQLPAAAGWTLVGAAPLAVAFDAGGTLLLQTVAAESRYELEVELPTAADRVHMYSRYWVESSGSSPSTAGLDLRGDSAPGSASDYFGVRMRARTASLATQTLTGAVASSVLSSQPSMWTDFLASADSGSSEGLLVLPNSITAPTVSSAWGTDSTGAPADPTLRASFGDVVGSNLVAHVRNVVVSEPGRFMRAFFNGYASLSTQVLRLYVVADIDGVGGDKARFKVRYGSGALGSDPFALGSASTASVTGTFTTRNTVMELSFSLSGLTAQAPFWFSVERDWAHADDLTESTLHLVSATVRPS